MADRSADRGGRDATVIRSTGTVALIAAFAVVLLEIAGTGTPEWPRLLAVVLAVTGVGLRIEAALVRSRGSA
ncbi:hypothetical protein FNH05_21925 [Amycolatopsis rhizosphaerae]|uniref:Uncharacterized protein n=1 Tax=Amycolatopsis rhizosphaerae TaxID=2053003 RepID=A0A558C5I3_9PSEU|nr:hypothetical protein [Amycolatopsis rhizosphaerae]TVT44045.1 hypothetical protein FNH05_21925 [Amycolatopsis rhizosphaerae]